MLSITCSLEIILHSQKIFNIGPSLFWRRLFCPSRDTSTRTFICSSSSSPTTSTSSSSSPTLVLNRSTLAFVFLSGVMVAVGAILLSDHLRELRSRRDSLQLQQQFLPDPIHMLVVEEASVFSQAWDFLKRFSVIFGASKGQFDRAETD